MSFFDVVIGVLSGSMSLAAVFVWFLQQIMASQ